MTFLAPRMLAWYATPPVDIGVSCDAAIHWGMSKLIAIQLAGMVLGAIMGAVMFFWIRGKSTPTAPATPAQAP
ncbi:MAG: hypothetical protein AB7K41_09025 [Bdellovibrionales bacterium]